MSTIYWLNVCFILERVLLVQRRVGPSVFRACLLAYEIEAFNLLVKTL